MPISSAQTVAPRRISPAERDYLMRQGNAILVNQGTAEDIANFTRVHLGLTPQDRRAAVVEDINVSGGAPAPRDPNKLLGLSTKAYQGLTFGFGDEFVGTLMGILPGGMTPTEGREEYRDILRAGSGSRVLDIIAELAGGVTTGATAARAAGLGAGALSQIGAGAAGGAASGFGNQTGSVTDRTKAALVGATFGGVLGGAVAGVSSVGGALLRQPTRAALDRLGALGQNLQHRLPGLGTSEDHARRVLLEVIDGETPVSEAQRRMGIDAIDIMRERALALREQGISPTIADVGGEGTLALVSETLGSRTPVKQELVEALFSRQAAQGQNLTSQMMRTVFDSDKFGLQNAYEAVTDISETMSRLAAPRYQEAYRQMVPVSGRMKTLILGNPKLRAAYEEGRRIADSTDLTTSGQHALTEGTLSVPPLPSGSLLKAAEEKLLALNVAPERMQEMLSQLPDDFPDEIPVRALDFMQQGLTRVKRRLLEGGGGIDTKEFIALNDTLEEIIGEATTASPIYGEARRMWAGFSAARDAVELGRGLSSKAPEIVSQEIKALSKRGAALTDFYRLGAMQDIVERVRGPFSKRETADAATEIFGGRIIRGIPDDADARRIRALFASDEAADDFMRRVAAETRLSRTAQAVGSNKPRSGTAFKEAEQAMEGTPPFGRSSAWLNAYSIARQSMMQGTKTFRSRVADDLASLFSRGIDSPESLDTLIDSLEDFKMRQLIQDNFGAKAKLGVSTALGSGVANLFAN